MGRYFVRARRNRIIKMNKAIWKFEWECFPEKDYSVIEWHGTAHKVPTKDIYKLENADETI